MRSVEAALLAKMRRLVLALVTLGLAGTAIELLLIAHNEDTKQIIPFFAIGLAITSVLWHLLSRSGASKVGVQLAMVVLIAVALIGMTLHYEANMEFQKEMDPSLSGLALMWKVLEAKAPPSLAPGNMALLGLFGLLGVYGGSRDER